jgi:hypothetical protein
MPSVASQIRIDILANAARFKADMREAGREGFGSFQDEFKKFQRSFDAQKQVMERSLAETRAWKMAMVDLNKDHSLFSPQDLMLAGAAGKDQGLSNSMRFKEMLPWGNSMRVELTREAAETAAAIGASKQTVIRSLAGAEAELRSPSFFGSLRGVGTAALGRGPLRPLSSMGVAIEDMSMATKGLGLFTAGLLISQMAAASLGRKITETREKANSLGQTYDQYVKRKGLPEYSRSTEGGALTAMHGWEGAKEFGKGLAAGTFGAVVDFFGNTDVSKIAESARSDEQNKLWERGMAMRTTQIQEAQQGLGGLHRELAGLQGTSEQLSRQEWIEKFKPTDFQIKAWDDLSLKIYKAKAAKEAESMAGGLFKELTAAQKPDSKGESEYLQKLYESGMGGDDIAANLRLFRQHRTELGQLTRANSAAASLMSPEDKYRQAMGDAETWHEYHHGRMQDEQTYQAMRMKAQQDYYREAAGLDAKQLKEEAKSDIERFRIRRATLQNMAESGALTTEEAMNAQDRDRLKERQRLGISDPLGDYGRSLKDLREALDAGLIEQGEFNKRRKELRSKTIKEIEKDDFHEVHPVGAMQAGSMEAHALIVNSMLADPKVKIAQDANAKLDQIEKNTRQQPIGNRLEKR